MHIGIIGAGVIGLTTALELQKEFPTAHVSIFADKFQKDTTSYVAAGIFRPGTSFCGPTEDITKQWIDDAFHHWDDLRKTSEGSLAGVIQLSGYIFSSTSPHVVRNHLIENLVPLYRSATEEELKICPGNWKYGSFFTTLLIECGYYLPWATNKFQQAGGQIITDQIQSFNDLYGKFDYTINCTGLGAKFLCNDHKLVPIRGQVLKVKAPWLKTAFYGDYDTYIIPGMDTVTLGGVRQYDSYLMDACKYDRAAIKERCETLVPSLKDAKLVREAVGLRPHRDPVRVEPELYNTQYGNMKIVHNYGHGGYGVTTAPGTSKYAVKILKDFHLSNAKL